MPLSFAACACSPDAMHVALRFQLESSLDGSCFQVVTRNADDAVRITAPASPWLTLPRPTGPGHANRRFRTAQPPREKWLSAESAPAPPCLAGPCPTLHCHTEPRRDYRHRKAPSLKGQTAVNSPCPATPNHASPGIARPCHMMLPHRTTPSMKALAAALSDEHGLLGLMIFRGVLWIR